DRRMSGVVESEACDAGITARRIESLLKVSDPEDRTFRIGRRLSAELFEFAAEPGADWHNARRLGLGDGRSHDDPAGHQVNVFPAQPQNLAAAHRRVERAD